MKKDENAGRPQGSPLHLCGTRRGGETLAVSLFPREGWRPRIETMYTNGRTEVAHWYTSLLDAISESSFLTEESSKDKPFVVQTR